MCGLESRYPSSFQAQTPLSRRGDQTVAPLFSSGRLPVEAGLGESCDLRLGISRSYVFQNEVCQHVNRMFQLENLG